eukprot:Nitzschia sp. Nitz4//scaffold15_size197535//106483//108073//NITZ4_001586-RA/size197535-augustus-gene-0.211-mRNA-1//1//CDS//3329537739//1801//frame0
MKVIVSTLLALVFGAEASNQWSSNDLNQMVRNGQIDVQKLVEKSVPVDRDLAVDYGTYNGNYTVRFNKCLSFSYEDIDLVADEDLVDFAQDGTLVSQKSFVLFDIAECEPGNCVFDERDLSKVHMVSLQDFVASFIQYFPNKRASYCDQCNMHYKYCMSGDGTYYDSATFLNGGSFCYNGTQFEMINCGQCAKMGCYGSSSYYDTWDEVGEWLVDYAQCQQTGTYWQNFPLYSGLMCNADGDGVEFGVFLDYECTKYNTQKQYKKVVKSNDWSMLSKMPSLIEFMFTSSISCKDDNEVKYMNAYQPIYNDWGQLVEGEEEMEQVFEEEGNTCKLGESINDSCDALFLDNELHFSLADCLRSAPEWSSNYQYSQQYSNEYYDTSDVDADWKALRLYKYDLSMSDLNNLGQICHKVALAYNSGKHTNVFSESGSGSMFDYSSAQNNYYASSLHDTVIPLRRLSGGEKFVIYLLEFIAVGVVAFAGYRVYKHKYENGQVQLVDKDLPLMS